MVRSIINSITRCSPLLLVALMLVGFPSDAAGQANQPINLNTASEAALQSIPGMPAHIAVLIVKYREEYGAFADMQELMKVPGVTREIFNRTSPRLAIKPSMPTPAAAPATPTPIILEVSPPIRTSTPPAPTPAPVMLEVPPSIRATTPTGTTTIAAPTPMIRTVTPAPVETGPPAIVITGIAPPTPEPVIRVEEPPAPRPSTSPFEAAPRLRTSRRDEPPPEELPVVERRFESPAEPQLPSYQPSHYTIALDVELTEVRWNKPFPIVLRAYDEMGLPAANFNAPVTYACVNGVAPILSPARWRNGHLFDTIVIARPGRNVRLTAMVGDAIAAVHLDVLMPAPDHGVWIRQANEFLSVGRFDEGIYALTKAAEMTMEEESAEIERRIARLYLDRGMWAEAEVHYQKALRAITR